jgi:hypothetical protein
MKTTIELSNNLFVEAKRRAAEQGCTLRSLIERGLRRELARSVPSRVPTRRRIRWVTVPGGLPAGVDIRSREAMHEWLRRHK